MGVRAGGRGFCTARSAAGLGQSTRTRGGGGSGAPHPLPRHPPSRRASQPRALGVSHSAHAAATGTLHRLRVAPMRQSGRLETEKEITERSEIRGVPLGVSCHTARAHTRLWTHMRAQTALVHPLLRYRHLTVCTETPVLQRGGCAPPTLHTGRQVCVRVHRKEQPRAI